MTKTNLTIERVFNAPRESVWKTWTDPELAKQWWGPKDYTAPTIKSDFRVGGKYVASMKGPDNKVIWSSGTYQEIKSPERLVLTDSFSDEKGNMVPPTAYGMPSEFPPELRIEIMFEEQNGKTKMTLRHIGLPPGEIFEQTKQGWNESFDKLARVVERTTGAGTRVA